MKVRRHHRVSELLRAEISSILRRSVKDPRLNLLTVNEVNLRPDLHSATVFVSRLISKQDEVISEKEQKEIEAGLQSASHFVYEQLKKRLVMKIIPSVKFTYDTRLDGLSRIWHLIETVKHEDSEGSHDEEQLTKN